MSPVALIITAPYCSDLKSAFKHPIWAESYLVGWWDWRYGQRSWTSSI